MTSLSLPRIHGWIVPVVVALAAVCALALPGIAHAADTSQTTTAVMTTTTAPTSTTSVTSATDTTTSADDGLVAGPDSASWR